MRYNVLKAFIAYLASISPNFIKIIMLFRYILNTLFIILFTSPTLSYAQNKSDQNDRANAADILFSLEKNDDSQQPVTGTMFTASAQLGFLYLTGDTKSVDIKTGMDLKFERDLWKSFFTFDLLVKKTETETETTITDDVSSSSVINKSLETTDHRWSLFSQTNYTLDTLSQNYLYGSVFYEENRFSSFDSQASMSTGWGRRWYDTRNFSLDGDIGPGFKRDVTLITEEEAALGVKSETLDSLILQAQALYIRRINEFMEFKQLVVIKHAIESGQNSIYKAESSITSRLIDSLQLKLNFIVDYNSKVDEDSENLNTETSAVLVYSF